MHIHTGDGAIRDATVRKDSWPGADYGGYDAIGVGSIPLVGLNASATYSAIYKSNPWVFAAVRAISLGMSRNALGVYRLESDRSRERVWYDSPGGDLAGADLDRKLNGPFKRVGAQRRMRRTVVDFLVHGNALWHDDPAGGYVHIPWKRCNPILDGNRDILGMRISSGTLGGQDHWAPEDYILFSGGDDPDSELGVSSIAALKYTLQLYEALQRHMVKFFENSARPSGNLKLSPQADIEKMEWMREQFRKLYASPENAGKVIVTTGDFQPITAAADQSQIIELTKLSREEIAAVYRIPAPVLGILDNAIKANVKELREQYTRDAIGSYAPIFEDEIRAQVIDPSPMYQGLFTEWDFEAQLRPDFESLVKSFKEMETTITTDERRAMLNRKPLGLPESETVASTPGATFLGIAPVTNGGDATSGGEASNEVTTDQAAVIGTLVRSGYDPEAAAQAAAGRNIEHLGLLPVTLQKAEKFDADADTAIEEAKTAGDPPPAPVIAAPPEPDDGSDPGEPDNEDDTDLATDDEPVDPKLPKKQPA